MRNQLQRYPSMVDVLADDYAAKYETWKRDFYVENMTDTPPITVGHVVFKACKSHEKPVIRFLATALIVIAVIFWIIPAIYYHNDFAKLDKIGTLEIVEDMLTEPALSGVYVKEDGKWREAEKSEIEYYMDTRADSGGSVCVD